MSKQIDSKLFAEAIDLIAKEKRISKTSVIEALKDAFYKAMARTLGADDADIHVEIVTEPEVNISLYVLKDVIADDEDDETAYEIPLSKAKLLDKKAKVGDKCRVDQSLDQVLVARVVGAVLKQKISDAEKVALYDEHKDKIGEMISGEVERCEERGCLVNIGRTSVYLPRKEMIGEEMYKPGEVIKLYIADVSNSEKGPQIKVSRSDAGFLKRLFEEEVHDIYDGTVVIKNIAREAGIRSKISVYSNDINVDPVSSCIGINGSAIQKISAQLGNAKEKEKIDVILYTKTPELYVIDALRPATVTNIYVNEDDKIAYAIVPDGNSSLAIGRKGANTRVASKLTGYDIKIHEEKEIATLMEEEGIVFLDPEVIRKEEAQRVQKENFEKYSQQIKSRLQTESALSTHSSEGIEKGKPQQITDDLFADEKPTKSKKIEKKVETKAIEEVKPEVVTIKEEVKETPKVEETSVVSAKEVKTTTTLESLEKELETEKKQETFKATKKESRRPRQITEEELPHEVKIDPLKNSMPIYTEEELAELEEYENEEDLGYEDEYEYDDYDSYYDDDK